MVKNPPEKTIQFTYKTQEIYQQRFASATRIPGRDSHIAKEQGFDESKQCRILYD